LKESVFSGFPESNVPVCDPDSRETAPVCLCLLLSFQAEYLALSQVQGNGGTESGHNTLENLLDDVHLSRFATA